MENGNVIGWHQGRDDKCLKISQTADIMIQSTIQKGARFGFPLLGAYAAALAGAVASMHAREFYLGLKHPAWAPPGWVFGPVWGVLYTMMGLAAGLVACCPVDGRKGSSSGSQVKMAMAFYGIQLAANAIWSWLFFAWHLGLAAFGDIVLLWLLIAGTIRVFYTVRPLAAILLLPYLAWVTFAAALCLAEWRLNTSVLGG